MKKRVQPSILVLALIVFLCPLAVVLSLHEFTIAQESIDARELYRENCAKCHGDDGRARTFRGYLTFAQNLTNPHWQALVDDDYISDAIKKGPGLMPGFEKKFSQAEIEALVGLVRNLNQNR